MRRPWALPLVPLYGAGLQVKNAMRDRGVGVRHLHSPVVSVGSLAAGGAGKTPVVLMLADLFARHGVAVDVLSRGFGRSSQAIEQVDPAGSAARFGDEPLELARAGLPVFVGAQRFRAGRLAEATGSPRIHLLDDGFQHRVLARTLDIVLLTLADARDALLPAGNLREPLRSLSRAHVVLLRRDEADELKPLLARWSQAEVWTIERHMLLPPAVPSRPFAFCALARPRDFLTGLNRLGLKPVAHLTFRDHHAYTLRDCERLAAAARQAGANGFVTTAKDAVKLPAAATATLAAAGPVAVAGLRVSLDDEPSAWSRLQPLTAGTQSAP